MFAIHRIVRRSSTFTQHNLTNGSIVIPIVSCEKINSMSGNHFIYTGAGSSRINNENPTGRLNNRQYFTVNQPNPYHGFTAFGFSTYPCNTQPQQFYPSNSNTMMSRSFSDTSVVDQRPNQFLRQSSDSAISKRSKNRSHIPSLRNWESTSQDTTKDKSGFQFTLMSYNVLAQKLIEWHPHLYKEHNQNCLQWKCRWEKLINEIKSINPDIICLQEVQESHIKDYYNNLTTAGYKGLFKKRTRECIDGCAIYYKPKVLDLVENVTVEYHQSGALLNRDNIAIIARFAPKNRPGEQFIVATTHLLYNPKREDVRLAQVQILLTEVDRMAFKSVINGKHTYLPTIITGDLNTPPYSNVYRFITNGSFSLDEISGSKGGLIPPGLKITDNCQHAALLRVRESTEVISRMKEMTMIELRNSDHDIEKIKCDVDWPMYSSGQISHNFPLKSVYGHFKGNDCEATTFQDKWLTVDYIFYSGKKTQGRISEDKLRLLQRYSLPLDSQLGRIHIPNHDLGSDHLSLAARFKLVF